MTPSSSKPSGWWPAAVPQAHASLADARILVIEDNATMRAILEAHLRRAGFTDIRIAENGKDGLKLAFAWAPDLVITDILMPDVDGYDVCRWLRAEPRFRDTPIIAQTMMEDVEARAAIFAAGATDLVIKPINGTELVSRVRIHIENRRLVARLTGYERRMAEELDAARAMQVSLMPGAGLLAEIRRTLPVDVAALYEASWGLSGDLWGIDDLGGGRLRVYTADFVGHGVGSALNTFRLHAFLKSGAIVADDPAAWLGVINGFLCETLPIGQFATMCCVDLDVPAGRLAIASAAAPPPAVATGDGFVLADVSGVPLGVTADARYDALDLPFPPGSELLLYSDVVIETPDPSDPVLPPADLVKLLDAGAGHRPPAATCAALREILATASVEHLADDLTLVMIRHREDEP
jgi:sigma-B regulation protein RsbU (phosphoserine phosphatase)